MNPGRFFFLIVCMLAVAQSAVGQVRQLVVEVETLSQLPNWALSRTAGINGMPTANQAPAIWPVWFAFHDGSIDTYDIGEVASAELARLATEAQVRPLVDRYASSASVSSFVVNTPWFYGRDPLEQGNPTARQVMVDPQRHAFFSFLGKLSPSDDAFVGNDDPQRHRVFDANGRFVGPLVFEIWGQDVLDAGARANNESSVFTIHRDMDLSAGTANAEAIGPHPGYRGSLRNPQQPAGILGVRGWECNRPDPTRCFQLDRVRGDFTRPGYPLLRIRISAGLDGSYSGTWFDPERSGEGFQFELTDGVQPQLVASWFTYAPDGSGRQLWLTGSGPLNFDFAELPLFETQGGRFGATSNPGMVRVVPRGVLAVAFSSCTSGRIQFTPSDNALPAVDYFIQRLTPFPRGTSQFCSLGSRGGNRPVDFWP